MAHEVYHDEQGIANMAYIGETPWWGGGNRLHPEAPLEEWAIRSGMNFKIKSEAVRYVADMEGGPQSMLFNGKMLLYREDNGKPLSVVSDRYQIVQPRAVLNFYEDLVEAAGFQLETAGVLFDGRKYWALASMNESALILGKDQVKGYMLLASSCDGSLATMASFTSIRVVCANTLGFSMNEAKVQKSRGNYHGIAIPHNSKFDSAKVKMDLGIGKEAFAGFIRKIEYMAKEGIDEAAARKVIMEAFDIQIKEGEDAEQAIENSKAAQRIMELFKGKAIGADMVGQSKWGLLNSCTQYLDHEIGRTQDRRMDSAWFGQGAKIKAKAMELLTV